MTEESRTDTAHDVGADARAELAAVTAKKRAAVDAGNFGEAAAWRDKERELQRKVGASGLYRVRIERPDGTYQAAESPTLTEALVLCGLTDISDEVQAVLLAARMLEKACHPLWRVVSSPTPDTAERPE